LQALLGACDYDFVWDATPGKPRAASSEGMEGQDEIEADEVDIIGDEGQGNTYELKGHHQSLGDTMLFSMH